MTKFNGAPVGQISAFLSTLKVHVSAKVVVLPRRPENRATLLSLEMTSAAAIQELLRLQPSDYIAGPAAAHDGSGCQMWEFVLDDVKGRAVYIKAYHRNEIGAEGTTCVSFHFPQRAFVKPHAPKAADGTLEE